MDLTSRPQSWKQRASVELNDAFRRGMCAIVKALRYKYCWHASLLPLPRYITQSADKTTVQC